MARKYHFSAVCFMAVAVCAVTGARARADVYNLKVVTDASPDYTNMDSMIHSITSGWKTDAEKM